MKYINSSNKVVSVTKILLRLVALSSILFSVIGCQNREPKYFPDVTIPFSENYFFSSISPDNELIAVVRNTGEKTSDGHSKWNLLVSTTMKIDWLPLFPNNDCPVSYIASAFSPDGTMLAANDQNGTLWIFETSHWSTIKIFHEPWIGQGKPVWSPDSKSIIIFGEGEIAISLLKIDGSHQYLLAHSDIFRKKQQIDHYDYLQYSNVTWSPDGKQIAYVARITSGDEIIKSQLWTLNIFSNQRVMLYEGQIGGRPSWSPDAKRIAFVNYKDIQIYDFHSNRKETVFTLKGTTSTNGIVSAALWAPDSTRIAFEVSHSPQNEDSFDDGGIYILNLSDARVIIEATYGTHPIQWVKGNDLVVSASTDNSNMHIAILTYTSK